MTTETKPSLDELTAQIQEALNESEWFLQKSVVAAVKAGELLIAAKEQVKHGQWQQWLEAELKLNKRTAQGYMKLAKQWPEIQEWAKVSGFKLHGTATHKVLSCWKESKVYRSDDYESAMLNTQALKPVFKAKQSPNGAAQSVGKSYPWHDVKPDEPTAFSPKYVKQQRIEEAKHLLWQAAELLSDASGESYLSTAGAQSLEAAIFEVEQLCKADT